jgi:hypothetical protein
MRPESIDTDEFVFGASIMSRWQITAVPPRAESTRIFDRDPRTGELYYRAAMWKPGGDFVPCDDAPGIGVDFDPKTGHEMLTGKVYPAAEL